MIDIEGAVFTRVRKVLRDTFLTTYPSLDIVNDRAEVGQNFPCVVLVQDDIARYQRGQSIETEEQYAEVTFTLEVFTAQESGGKTLAKRIADVADRELIKLNFSRITFTETPNMDRKIKRYTGRYRAIVSKAYDRGTDAQNRPELEYYLYRR